MPAARPTSLLDLPDDVLLHILRMVAFGSVCNSRARPQRQRQFDLVRSLHPHLYYLSLRLMRSMAITAAHVRAPLSTLHYHDYRCPVAGCVARDPAASAPGAPTGTAVAVLLFLLWHRAVDQLDVADGELCPHASLALLRRLERGGGVSRHAANSAAESVWSAPSCVRKVVLREHRSEMESLGATLHRLPRLTNIAIKTPSLRTVQQLIARQLYFDESSTNRPLGTGAAPRLFKPPSERTHAVAALKVLHLLCIDREAMALLKRFLRHARPLCSIMLHTSYFDFVEEGGIDTNWLLDVSEWRHEARYIAAAHTHGISGIAVLLGKRSIREATERSQKQYSGNQYVIEVDPDTDFVSSGIDAEALGLGRPAACTPHDGRPLLCARAGSRTYTLEMTPTKTNRAVNVSVDATGVDGDSDGEDELSVNEAALQLLYHVHPVTLRLTRRRYKPIHQYGFAGQYSAQVAMEEEEAKVGTPNMFNIDETSLDEWCPCCNTARSLTPTVLATRPFEATPAIEGSFCVVREQYVPVGRLLSTARRGSHQYVLREDRIPDTDGTEWGELNDSEFDYMDRGCIERESRAVLYAPQQSGDVTIRRQEVGLVQRSAIQRSCFHVILDFNTSQLKRDSDVYHHHQHSAAAQCVSISLDSFLVDDDGDDDDDDDDDKQDQKPLLSTQIQKSTTSSPLTLLSPRALFIHGYPLSPNGVYNDDEARTVCLAWQLLPLAIDRSVRLSTIIFLSLHASAIPAILAPPRLRTVATGTQGLHNRQQARICMLSSLSAVRCIHIVGGMTSSTNSLTSSLSGLCDLLDALLLNDPTRPSQHLCPFLRCITWHAGALPDEGNCRNSNASGNDKASSQASHSLNKTHDVHLRKGVSACLDRIAALTRRRPGIDVLALRALLHDRGAQLDRHAVYESFRLDDPL